SRQEQISWFTFEDLGFDRQTPARTWSLTIDAGLTAADGQTLGYAWTGVVENWHDRAFANFGDGHGVWETGGGPLPFYARNFSDVWQWAARIAPDRLMPTIVDLQKGEFHAAPADAGSHRTLGVTPDKIQSHGLDLSRALQPAGTSATGLVWTAVKRGTPIDHARTFSYSSDTIASIVQ